MKIPPQIKKTIQTALEMEYEASQIVADENEEWIKKLIKAMNWVQK